MKNYWVFVITGMLLIVTTRRFGRMVYGVILPFMQEGMSFKTTQSGYLGTMLFLGYFKKDPIWDSLPAVKNDHLYVWPEERSWYMTQQPCWLR
ncbi:hypothetical protein QH639_07035 [Lysinibacillus sp. 1 U-2021]|nr:hypothetical protein [Lysinibacillus sp. 1 U-2021]WGT40517.1 hypothetical protein QH639_07035 [Lysinibacillus sp. 1 U-2021]